MATVQSKLASLSALIGLAVGSLSCSGGTTDSSQVLSPNVRIVLGAATMGALAFSPDTLTISLADGGQVLWRNADFTVSTYGNVNGTIHQVTANGATFDSGPLDPKGAFTFTFTSAGIYGYHCSIHPSMIGAIVVTP